MTILLRNLKFLGALMLCCVCGCSGQADGTSNRGPTADDDRARATASRQHVKDILTQLQAPTMTDERFLEIASEIEQFERRPEITDLELSDMRQAASRWWDSREHSATLDNQDLKLQIEQLGGRFKEVPYSQTVMANFEGVSISDDELASIAGLERVTALVVRASGGITDRSATVVVERCGQLNLLDIRSTGITDEGLALLEQIDSLRTVDVNRHSASSAGIERLEAALASRRAADLAARIEMTKKRREQNQAPTPN